MIIVVVFLTALAAAALAAFLRGGQAERLAAGATVTAAILTPVVSLHRYAGPEFGIILVDAALLAVFVHICTNTTRFWPIWVTGFHAGALSGHLAAVAAPGVRPIVYADTVAIFSFAVLIALTLGSVYECGNRERQ